MDTAQPLDPIARLRRICRIGCLATVASVLGLSCRGGPLASPDLAQASPLPVAASTSTSTTREPTPEPGWTTVDEEDGILVTKRPSKHSPLPMFRGEGVVDAPLLQVLAVISDADRHHEWVYSCSASRMIEQTSDATGIVYNRTETPWPVPDRDVVLRSHIESLDGEREVRVRFSATEHPERPPEDGVVRMTYLHGHYHLWAEDDGYTRVQYQVDSDPGGSLPAWLATRGTREMPLGTLRGLRTQLARTRGTYDERIAILRKTVLSSSGASH